MYAENALLDLFRDLLLKGEEPQAESHLVGHLRCGVVLQDVDQSVYAKITVNIDDSYPAGSKGVPCNKRRVGPYCSPNFGPRQNGLQTLHSDIPFVRVTVGKKQGEGIQEWLELLRL